MSAIIAAERSAVRARCVALVKRLFGPLVDVVDATDFHRDLNADSIDLVSLAVEAEEEFGISISDDEASALDTFGEMVALVEAKLQARPSQSVLRQAQDCGSTRAGAE